MTEAQLLQLYKNADAFLNVTGAQELRDEHLAIPRRIYVESDPFASQVRVANGDQAMIDMLSGHDTLFTFGENIGASDCGIPETRFQWLPTRQPVVLDLWETHRGSGGKTYNTITTWHNKGKNVTYNGETYYWTKDREFEKFIEVPLRRRASFELATRVDDDTVQYLHKHGWAQIASEAVSNDITRYRNYIQQSRGEFTVARDQYVRPNTGWFSDRSACYLAAGRPVITQETGFSKFLPTGKGLFSFKTSDDILEAVDQIECDFEGNCDAARNIASEFFEAEKVLGSLMNRSGI